MPPPPVFLLVAATFLSLRLPCLVFSPSVSASFNLLIPFPSSHFCPLCPFVVPSSFSWKEEGRGKSKEENKHKRTKKKGKVCSRIQISADSDIYQQYYSVLMYQYDINPIILLDNTVDIVDMTNIDEY